MTDIKQAPPKTETVFDLTGFDKAQEFVDAGLSGKYRIIWYGGGIRGGKSFNGVGLLSLLHNLYPESRSCIVRKDLPVLRRNTLPTCKKAIPKTFIKQYNASNYEWTFHNGSHMFFFPEGYDTDKELDRWNGLEVNFIMLDQAEELQYATWEKANERVGSYFLPKDKRQPPPLIIATVNPTQGWVKKEIYDKYIAGTLPEGWLYIPALVTDNPHVDPAYMESLQNLKLINPVKYKRFVEGDWEIQDNIEGAFYKDFDYDRNVGCESGDFNVYYEESEALHITFDFNINPYVTLIVCQIIIEDNKDLGADETPYKKLNVIDEFCLGYPKNRTTHACRAFAKKYDHHRGGLFIYGDPAGKHQDTRTEQGYDDFKIIKKELKDFRPRERVAASAPPVVMRGNFINTIFEQGFEGIEIHIDQDCTNVIKDYIYVLEDSDGKKLKKKTTDSKTKVSAQDLTHTSDALDYLIVKVFNSEFKKYQRSTDVRSYEVADTRNTRH